MCSQLFNNKELSASRLDASKSADRLRLAIQSKKRIHTSSKDDAYMNLFASKRLTPNPKTLAKVKGWMNDNELNQREAARILCISQTKLSHYLNGRKKIRGWFKLEDKIKEVMNNFEDKEPPSTSSEDEEEFNSRSDAPVSDDKDEESSSEYSDPSDGDSSQLDHWNSFSLNEIFQTKKPPKK
jgi:predicted XRE-type DNA-binding protein